jgi:hypothetical protein
LIVLIVTVFGIYNFVWFYYVDYVFSPFLQNEKLTEFEVKENGWTLNEFRDVDGQTGRVVRVLRPRYLHFDGGISVTVFSTNDEESFLSTLIIHHVGNVFSMSQEYELLLGTGEVNDGHPLGFTVDKHGTPVGRSPEQPETHYETWLLMHEILNDEIMGLMDYAKDFFGNEAFW